MRFLRGFTSTKYELPWSKPCPKFWCDEIEICFFFFFGAQGVTQKNVYLFGCESAHFLGCCLKLAARLLTERRIPGQIFQTEGFFRWSILMFRRLAPISAQPNGGMDLYIDNIGIIGSILLCSHPILYLILVWLDHQSLCNYIGLQVILLNVYMKYSDFGNFSSST